MGPPTGVGAAALAAVLPELTGLPPETAQAALTAMNGAPGPCESCRGADWSLARCAVEQAATCPMALELVRRAFRLAVAGGPGHAIQLAVSHGDAWFAVDDGEGLIIEAEGAPVTVHLWLDLAGPFAGPAWQAARAVRGRFGEDLRLVVRPMALPDHAGSREAAAALLAAGRQGAGEAFLDAAAAMGTDLAAAARGSGLDVRRFEADRAAASAAVERERAAGEALGVRASPTWFVEGFRLRGARDVEELNQVVQRELAAHWGG
jgi:hypothetical protein